ncbi:MAG: radical SAM protein [Candidatus Heimdallarchaeota archaeon]
MDSLHNQLKVKLAILTRGLKLPSNEVSGRKGGAGPTRGRYFWLDRNVINAPMYSGEQAERMRSLTIQKTGNKSLKLLEFGVELRSIPFPAFYQETLPNGTPMRKIALLHGTDCLATTIIQRCDYWPTAQCLFCSIPYSYQTGQTVLRKKPEDFLQVLKAANRKNSLIKHVTLTSGTLKQPDRGIQAYADFVSAIRQESNIPIHVQIEPPDTPTMLDTLVDVGVDTIGIHLEIFNAQRRQYYCPGKVRTASFTKYQQTWQHAVDLFGRNQVSSYILFGLNESTEEILTGVQKCADLGVIPLLTPFRPADKTPLTGMIPSYIGQQDLMNLHQQVGVILKDSGITPEESKAGCARCGACSAIGEAIAMA